MCGTACCRESERPARPCDWAAASAADFRQGDGGPCGVRRRCCGRRACGVRTGVCVGTSNASPRGNTILPTAVCALRNSGPARSTALESNRDGQNVSGAAPSPPFLPSGMPSTASIRQSPSIARSPSATTTPAGSHGSPPSSLRQSSALLLAGARSRGRKRSRNTARFEPVPPISDRRRHNTVRLGHPQPEDDRGNRPGTVRLIMRTRPHPFAERGHLRRRRPCARSVPSSRAATAWSSLRPGMQARSACKSNIRRHAVRFDPIWPPERSPPMLPVIRAAVFRMGSRARRTRNRLPATGNRRNCRQPLSPQSPGFPERSRTSIGREEAAWQSNRTGYRRNGRSRMRWDCDGWCSAGRKDAGWIRLFGCGPDQSIYSPFPMMTRLPRYAPVLFPTAP